MTTSPVDRPFSLAELLDLSVFREVAGAFALAFRTNVRIFGADGRILIETREPTPLCRELAKLDPTFNDRCRSVGEKMARLELAHAEPAELEMECGCRYAAFPLTHQLEDVGRAVIGPYRRGEWRPDRLAAACPRLAGLKDPGKILRPAAQQMPNLGPETFQTLTRLLAKVLDAFMFVNAKRLVTTRLHLDSIFAARHQTARPPEDAGPENPETDPEVARLKGLF